MLQMLGSGATIPEILINILLIGLALVIVMPVHEFAHAYTAYKLGDTSQLTQGRLTLNPLKHLDPFGAICILLTGFGWAKPVYVNVALMKKGGRFAHSLVAMAGPFSNILLAIVFAFLYRLLGLLVPLTNTFVSAVELFFIVVFIISINLALFNLIPIPPLDGFGIINPLFPQKAQLFIRKLTPVFSIVFILLLLGDRIPGVPEGFSVWFYIQSASSWLQNLIMKGVSLIV